MADYDGDGLTDLISGCACCEHAFGFYVFRRQKDGSFAPRRRVSLDYPEGRFDRFGEFPISGLKTLVAVADWNGDGVPDVLIGGITPILGVAYGPLAGKDVLAVERVWRKGEEPFQRMTTNPCVVDWDGDGLADLVVGGWVGQRSGIYWLRNVGTKREPKLAEPKLLIPEDGSMSAFTGICVADWNGDGRPDLIVSRQETYSTGPGSTAIRRHQIWVYLRRAR